MALGTLLAAIALPAGTLQVAPSVGAEVQSLDRELGEVDNDVVSAVEGPGSGLLPETERRAERIKERLMARRGYGDEEQDALDEARSIAIEDYWTDARRDRVNAPRASDEDGHLTRIISSAGTRCFKGKTGRLNVRIMREDQDMQFPVEVSASGLPATRSMVLTIERGSPGDIQPIYEVLNAQSNKKGLVRFHTTTPIDDQVREVYSLLVRGKGEMCFLRTVGFR